MAFDTTRPRVLVAEDDPAILELVTVRLQRAGYEVGCAHDGREAVRDLATFRPHVLVLDVNMPGLDGFGVLSELRGRRELVRTPVLMLTARNAAQDVDRARELGADDYLSKPFEEAQLLARVRRLMRARLSASPSKVSPPPVDAPPRATTGADGRLLSLD